MRGHTDDWEAMFDPQYSMDSPRHKRPGRRRDMTASAPQTPSLGTPAALPSIDILAHSRSQQDMTSSSSTPPPSHPRPHDQLWADRMDLLRTIREQGHTAERHPAIQHRPHWRDRLRFGVRQEVSDTSSDEDDDEEKQTGSTDQSRQDAEQKRRKQPPYRRSFLYFVFGFLFPPLWIIGAMHVPPQQQSPDGHAIDLQWRRRCRNVFFLFIATVLVVLIIALVFKPASVGWRVSAPLPQGTVHY